MKTILNSVGREFRILGNFIKGDLAKPSPPRHGMRILVHLIISCTVFGLMIQGFLKEVEKDNWVSARLWLLGAFGAPLCYLLLCMIFSIQRRISKGKHFGTYATRLKTQQQKIVEDGWNMRKNKELRLTVRKGLLPLTELSTKIKFPVLGFKGTDVSVFHIREDTSHRLPIADITQWSFYDANACLVQPSIVPPLTGWRRHVRQHFLGKLFLDIPLDGWVWFHLRHPVESCHNEVVMRLNRYLTQCEAFKGTENLSGLIAVRDCLTNNPQK